MKDFLFPGADYTKYGNFSPVELLQLFCDGKLCKLLVGQSVFYAHSKRETNFVVTQNEIKVFYEFRLRLNYDLCRFENYTGKMIRFAETPLCVTL